MNELVSFFGERSKIFEDLNRRAREYAAAKGMAYRWAPQVPYDREDVIKELKQADAGIIDVEPYGEEIFQQIHDSCRLLVRFGVGYDKVDLTAASRYGIAVARTTGANTTAVAEMALLLILAARRKLNINRKCVESGEWRKHVAGETAGNTVGILGFGNIGRALAGLLKGFGCTILAYDTAPKLDIMKEMNVELVTINELFSRSDAISIHVPYTPETHHLVGNTLLGLMKPTAVIVNTARGNIIDETALYEALKSGKIAGAGLDVFAQEPLPAGSPLLALDNIVLTPHVSSQTVESLWRIYTMAIDIADDFFRGIDSPHVLNPDYKKERL